MTRTEAQAVLNAARGAAVYAGARGADAEDATSIGVLAVLELRARGRTVRNAPALARVVARRVVRAAVERAAVAKAAAPQLSAFWDAGLDPAPLPVGGRVRHGTELHNAKLDPATVRRIRARYAAGGVRQRELAAEYGVAQSCISNALRGARWAAVSGAAS